MAWNKRFGPAPAIGSKPMQAGMHGYGGDLRFSLRVGEVIRIDYENMVCDIEWLQGSGPIAKEVPVTSPYWSKRSFLGVMPEAGAIAVCGFSTISDGKGSQPYILTFLPNGFKTALRFDPYGTVGRADDDIDVTENEALTELQGYYGVTRHKMRKIYPGDLYGTSSKGSELILDQGVRLLDRSGSQIKMREEDGSISLNSLDFYQETASGFYASGRIVRNALNVDTDFLEMSYDSLLNELLMDAGILFEDGSLIPDINSLPSILLPDGERHSVITENGVSSNDMEALAFTESRKEIHEYSDQVLGTGREGFEIQKTPYIEKVHGTLVGNDPHTVEGRSQYGKLLKPTIFSSPSDTEGSPRMEIVENEEQETEKSLVAASLYRMRRPDGLGEVFIAHDKEGHYYISIPASTSKKSNLGAGRSVEADIKGSIKMVLGANKADRESMDLHAAGGFRWSLGTLAKSNRSLDLTSAGGLALHVRKPDVDGYALKGNLTGDIGLAVDGSLGVSISQDQISEIRGALEVSSESSKEVIGIGGKQAVIGGSEDNTIQGAVNESIGGGRAVTILTAGIQGTVADRLNIISGSRSISFLGPATHETSFTTLGTYRVHAIGALTTSFSSDSIGDFSYQAPTGTYSVDLSSGSITLTSGIGTISLSAGASISLEAASIGLTGSVGLGSGASSPHAVVGGIAGPSPHIDYLTGLPLTGNPKVRTV